MKKFLHFILFLLCIPLMSYAQLESSNRYIAAGIEIRPIYSPTSYHLKFIANDLPSFILKYSKLDVLYNYEDVYINNNFSRNSSMNFKHYQVGNSLKVGYVVSKDIDINYVTYTCIYASYIDKQDVLAINKYDNVHGNTTTYFTDKNHSFSGEVEFYAGLRAIKGHLNVGASLYFGYLPPPIHPFKNVILNYPETNVYTYPDRGFGIYLFYMNAGLSAALCF